MLQVRELTKFYKGKAVLSEVSFSLADGEVLGIVGPNGAGKSTLLKIVSGIIDPDKGDVFLDAEKLNIKLSKAWGYLPEERGLYPQMKVMDQLVHFAGLKGLSAHEAKSKAKMLLEECNMLHYSDTKAGDLSKGNQQRIQFISSVLHDPQLLILDEPFSGLDPIQTDWLKLQIHQFRQKGKKIIYSSHHMDTVEALCDRILILHEGRTSAHGTASELCTQPSAQWQVTLCGGDDLWLNKVTVISKVQRNEKKLDVVFSLNDLSLSAVMLAIEESGAELEVLKRYKKTLHEVFVQHTKAVHDE